MVLSGCGFFERMEKLGNIEVCEIWGPLDIADLLLLWRDVALRGTAVRIAVEADVVCEE